jgi:hypothetical protein
MQAPVWRRHGCSVLALSAYAGYQRSDQRSCSDQHGDMHLHRTDVAIGMTTRAVSSACAASDMWIKIVCAVLTACVQRLCGNQLLHGVQRLHGSCLALAWHPVPAWQGAPV